MKKYIFCLLITCLALSSCESLLFEEELASTDPKANFDYLWNECNEKYSYFELKNIDWDSVRAVYEPRLSDDMTQDSLFNVLGGMLSELRDDHTNLISNFNISSFGVEYLGQDNFDWRIIVDNYIGQDYYVSGPFRHNFIADGEIGYIRFPSFSGGVNFTNLDFILKRYLSTRGLIIDLRENGGGTPRDMFNLLGRFVGEETLIYYSKIKTGKSRNDFSEPVPAYLEPYEGFKYLGRVIFLVDRGTYSAGSFTALATKAIPNITLIGDTTGGGLGLPNGGQLPNGWRYRFSITQTLDLNKNPEFEQGVPPDIPALIDWNDRTKDEVIERAIEELL